MSARFFNPWIGNYYWDGLGDNEYCVLVLGASVYCSFRRKCPYFDECTSGDNQDSSEFNNDCPFPEKDSNDDATPLEDYPIHVCSPTMTKFENKMEDRFGEILGGDSIWDHVAFTEYVQYFMDHQDTYPCDLSERDFDAFLETLDELRPDLVIVWGNVVADVLRESEYSVEVDDDDPWDFAWEYKDMFIRFICCTHPASRGYFYNDFPEFANQFEETIDNGDEDDDDEDDEDKDDDEEDKDDEDEDDDEGDDEEDKDEEDEDEEDEDDDEGDDDEDEDDDEGDDEDEDEDEDDEDEDDEDEDEDDCASSRNTHNRLSCDLTLGLIMERGFNQWKSGR